MQISDPIPHCYSKWTVSFQALCDGAFGRGDLHEFAEFNSLKIRPTRALQRS